MNCGMCLYKSGDESYKVNLDCQNCLEFVTWLKDNDLINATEYMPELVISPKQKGASLN